jgi:hypothetical protein
MRAFEETLMLERAELVAVSRIVQDRLEELVLMYAAAQRSRDEKTAARVAITSDMMQVEAEYIYNLIGPIGPA